MFVGWPFTIVVYVPMALDLIFRKGIFNVLLWSFFSLIYFLLPSVIVDYFFYHKILICVWNIFLYNATGNSLFPFPFPPSFLIPIPLFPPFLPFSSLPFFPFPFPFLPSFLVSFPPFFPSHLLFFPTHPSLFPPLSSPFRSILLPSFLVSFSCFKSVVFQVISIIIYHCLLHFPLYALNTLNHA